MIAKSIVAPISLECRRPPQKNFIHLYDSVMGKSVRHGGDKLQYREFILYESAQAYPEYVIQYKRSAISMCVYYF